MFECHNYTVANERRPAPNRWLIIIIIRTRSSGGNNYAPAVNCQKNCRWQKAEGSSPREAAQPAITHRHRRRLRGRLHKREREREKEAFSTIKYTFILVEVGRVRRRTIINRCSCRRRRRATAAAGRRRRGAPASGGAPPDARRPPAATGGSGPVTAGDLHNAAAWSMFPDRHLRVCESIWTTSNNLHKNVQSPPEKKRHRRRLGIRLEGPANPPTQELLQSLTTRPVQIRKATARHHENRTNRLYQNHNSQLCAN